MTNLKTPHYLKKKRKVILHVGGPKCASSTIQKYLTEQFSHARAVERSDAATARYYLIRNYGQVVGKGAIERITGKGAIERVTGKTAIEKIADKGSAGYTSSLPIQKNPVDFRRGLKAILNRVDTDEIPILSHESWIQHKFIGDARNIFTDLNVEVEVFAVIRAPVDFINASWWQWGVWSGQKTLSKYSESIIPATLWHNHLKHWKTMPGVARLKVVDLRNDPMGAFKAFIGATDDWDERSNASSSAAVLEFLLSQPHHLGRTAHSPHIEFALNRFVEQPPCPKPFVIGPKIRRQIINRTKGAVHKNMEFLSSSNEQNSHIEDPAYTDPEYYRGRVLRRMKEVALPKERYEFRVALAKYLSEHPNPKWMSKHFDRAVMEEEIRLGTAQFS